MDSWLLPSACRFGFGAAHTTSPRNRRRFRVPMLINVGFFVMGPEGVYGFQLQILMAHRLRMRSQSEK